MEIKRLKLHIIILYVQLTYRTDRSDSRMTKMTTKMINKTVIPSIFHFLALSEESNQRVNDSLGNFKLNDLIYFYSCI